MVCGNGVPAFRHLQSCVPGLRSGPICVSLSPLPPAPAPECPTSQTPALFLYPEKKRVYFSNPPIGDLSLTQEYLHVWNMCLEQFCAVLSFWSHAHGDAPEALAAAGWDVPSLAVCSDLPLPSKNVSPVFEDQAFKTGI